MPISVARFFVTLYILIMNTTQTVPANRYMMQTALRVYLYDLDTRSEIDMGGALGWAGSSEFGIRNGVRFEGTALDVQVVDFRARKVVTLTAESFPGRRVAFKVWAPSEGTVEWRRLVSRSEGWQGNEVDTGRLGRSTALVRR